MPFEMYRYRRVGDLEKSLRDLPCRPGRVFLVADSADRDLLSSILRAEERGRRVAPFKIRRWDELYRYFAVELGVERPKVQIDPPDHWLLLSGVLSRYVQSGGQLPPGASSRGFPRILGEQIRELIREEIAPESLDALYAEDDRSGRAFVELYRLYRRALDENNLSDSAGIATEATELLERGETAAVKKICSTLDINLVGFSSFTHSQLRLVRWLVGSGARVRCFSPEGGMTGAYGAAQQFGEDGLALGREESPFRVTLLEGGDPRQELETVARSLALWERGRGPLASSGWPGWESIALTVPRDRLSQAREVFSRYALPCHWNFRLKVSETPLWHLSSACLDASSGGWQTEAVLRLLALPWLCGFEADVKGLRQLHLRGKKRWLEALEKSDPDAAADFKSCVAYAETVKRGGTALQLLQALRRFAGTRALSAARKAIDVPDVDETLALFSSALEELDRKILFIEEVVRDLGTYDPQRLADADARAFLSAWAEGTTVPQAQGEAGCMTVFADTPPTLFHARRWFFVGADASAWPGGLKESPLLGEDLKQRLHDTAALGLDRSHLPLLSEKRQQREFLFRRLIACGDDGTCLCSSAEDQRQHAQEVTPLLKAAEADGWVRVEAKISRAPADILPSAADDALTPVEARRPDLRFENTLPPQRSVPGKLEATAARISLSSVDDYAACPYMFALRHLLKYGEPPRDGEYDAARGGTALHRLGQNVWQDPRVGSSQETLPSALAGRFFDEVFEEIYPELMTLPALRRNLKDLRRAVSRCGAFQDSLEPVLRPLRKEVLCEYDLPPLTLDGVTFSGRCDRLDRLSDGSFFLWDYKSGSSSGFRGAMQLAAYALALEKSEGRCAGWAYLTMKDGSWTGVWSRELAEALGLKRLRDDQRPEAAMPAARQLLENMAASLKAGSFPPKFDSDACRYCSYAGMCRRGELTGEIEDDENGEGPSDQ
ncbi:MAG: PD-(D/E)XK nuclease family protein [Pyramidobacter sp.]